jgi:hypothetical protein
MLLRLQGWARMVPWRAYQRALTSLTLNVAATTIQRARRHGMPAPADGPRVKGPPSAGRAAFMIQRCWRGFTNRRIFGYLREMLLFREQGDAKELLRSINPREAGLIDAATAIHVRFRLGGSLFPPAIYYKVYTHAPVTDVGAFAPRDYQAAFQPPPVMIHNHVKPSDARAELLAAANSHSGWYRRAENNGWRPVAGSALGDMDTTARTSKPVVWHHDKFVRKEAAERKRKERKRAWLREMYSLGKASEADGPKGWPVGIGSGPGMPPAGGFGDEDDEDDDFDELLQWTDALDFDSYHADWLSLATSSRPEMSWQPREVMVEGAGGTAPATAEMRLPAGLSSVPGLSTLEAVRR